jgi:hypothetical protein
MPEPPSKAIFIRPLACSGDIYSGVPLKFCGVKKDIMPANELSNLRGAGLEDPPLERRPRFLDNKKDIRRLDVTMKDAEEARSA